MVTAPLLTVTSTVCTPLIAPSSSVTERAQCSQLIPVTVTVVRCWACTAIGNLHRVSLIFWAVSFGASGRSGAHESGDRLGGLADFGVGLLVTGPGRVHYAAGHVLGEQLQRERLKRSSGCRDLRQHVDAVDILRDHPLQAANPELHPGQPESVGILPLGLARH